MEEYLPHSSTVQNKLCFSWFPAVYGVKFRVTREIITIFTAVSQIISTPYLNGGCPYAA